MMTTQKKMANHFPPTFFDSTPGCRSSCPGHSWSNWVQGPSCCRLRRGRSCKAGLAATIFLDIIYLLYHLYTYIYTLCILYIYIYTYYILYIYTYILYYICMDVSMMYLSVYVSSYLNSCWWSQWYSSTWILTVGKVNAFYVAVGQI